MHDIMKTYHKNLIKLVNFWLLKYFAPLNSKVEVTLKNFFLKQPDFRRRKIFVNIILWVLPSRSFWQNFSFSADSKVFRRQTLGIFMMCFHDIMLSCSYYIYLIQFLYSSFEQSWPVIQQCQDGLPCKPFGKHFVMDRLLSKEESKVKKNILYIK